MCVICCARCCASAGSRRNASSCTRPRRSVGFMHLYDGEEAVSVGVIEALRPEDAIVATYREHGQALARGIGMNRLMAEMLRQAGRLLPRPRRLDAHLRRAPPASMAATPSSAAACRSRSASRWATRCRAQSGHRLLLRRRRGGRGRVPRKHEPAVAVAAAGAVRLREQPLRDGHGGGARRGGNRYRPQGRRLSHARARRWTAWTWSRSRLRRARRSRRFAPTAGRNSCWNAAPTGSAPIRCSTRSCIAASDGNRDVARRRSDRAAAVLADRDGAAARGRSTTASRPRSAAEIDAAVAFAEAGTLEPIEELERFVTWIGCRNERQPAWRRSA